MNEEKLTASIEKVSLFEQALLSMRIQRLVNIQDLSIYLGMSMTYIRELVKAGTFPKPIQEGRYLKWDIVEVDHYIERKKAERHSVE
ncbi:helix-turn-helix transcriptional regulator [Bartonella rattaustraliani]|uniref:helix-turn-helix transcriptional regulator n=1 Tax=Bartonella rattaustraliani TaxID=481139 RepID=UPI00030621E0|nr:AlpA family phage regulatory protein [Bartonella rattaustraliani]